MKTHMIIAIDGPSGAGKTTYAKQLAHELGEPHNAAILHIDDYYDCSAGRLKTEAVVAAFHALKSQGKPVIVEGVYSLTFGFPYDRKIFMTVRPEEQLKRIKARSPDLYDKYVSKWIPAENKYFQEGQIAAKCDLVISND
ncbi:MAG: AAA family ATPase [Oscillospiraceae bacterium]|nr:AAA family ATPase [Oscillospiraceae bacterium]